MFLACIVSSLQFAYLGNPSSLCSTCQNHLIPLAWCEVQHPNFECQALREGSLKLNITNQTDHCPVITPKMVQSSHSHVPSLCSMKHDTSHTSRIHPGQKCQVVVREKGKQWAFSQIDFSECKTAASSQPPPETISLNSNSMRPVPQFHHQPPQLVCGLAMPKFEAQLKPRPGHRVSLTPLHLFCIKCSQLAQTWHWSYRPFQSICSIQSLSVTLDSIDIYGSFTLKEQFHYLYTRKGAKVVSSSHFTVKTANCLFQRKVHVETKHSHHYDF